MADGSIVFSTELDNKKAEKQLKDFSKKAERTLEKGSGSSKTLTFSTDVSKAEKELERIQSSVRKLEESVFIKTQQLNSITAEKAALEGKIKEATLKNQDDLAKELTKEWDKLNTKANQYAASIREANIKIQSMQELGGELAGQVAGAGDSTNYMADAVSRAEKYMAKFTSRVKKLASRVFVFTLITTALRSVRTWLGNVIKTNTEATAAIAKLKGALLTLAQPLVNVIIPAFTAFVNILAKIVSAIAALVSSLFGTTIEQSKEAAEALYDETSALTDTGNAAKKASKSLASFDEINKLAGDTAEAGGAAAGTIAPVFELDTNAGSVFDVLKNKAEEIGEDIKTIFSGVGDFISGVFTENFDKALDGLVSALGGARDLIVDLLELADALVGGFIDSIIEKFDLGGTVIGNVLLGVKQTFHGIVEFITGILNGDLTKAILGIEDVFDGLKTAIIKVFNSLIAILPAPLANLLQLVRDLFADVLDTAKEFLTGVIQFINGVFSGDWHQAWKGIVNMCIALLNGLVAAVEAVFGFIARAINELIEAINKVVVAASKMVGTDWNGISWRATEPKFGRIPLLAQGAVIPPNKEFLAVLGDQKQGTNIETPLATMVQAFKQALAETGYGGSSEAVLMLDRDVLGKVVYRLNKSESNRIGVNLTEV